jgi:hypothetical protein
MDKPIGLPPPARQEKRNAIMSVRSLPRFARLFDSAISVAFVALSLVLAGATAVAGV